VSRGGRWCRAIPSGILDIQDEGHVDEPGPGGHVGQIGHPPAIRAIRAELPLDPIRRSLGRLVHDRGAPEGPTPHDAPKPHLGHQTLDRAAGHLEALALQLEPDLASPVDRAVLLPDPLDLRAQRGVAHEARRQATRIDLSRVLLVVGRRGDRQRAADRLDPVRLPLFVEERHHHFALAANRRRR
jgi:hypothetical protein